MCLTYHQPMKRMRARAIPVVSVFHDFTFPSNIQGRITSGGTTNALVWSGTSWSAGADNIQPTNQTNISSFDALDQAIRYVRMLLSTLFTFYICLTVDI